MPKFPGHHPVVNIRGTSGSGKSTVVTKIMHLVAGIAREKAYVGGDSFIFLPSNIARNGSEVQVGSTCLLPRLFIAGRYATACGGCDGLSWKGAADDICNLVKEQALVSPVLFEGLMVSSWGTPRLINLCSDLGGQLTIIQLTTSLEECVASVNARRLERWRSAGKTGEPPPLDPANTAAKHRGTLKSCEKLEAAGVPVLYLSREEAFRRTAELLGLAS
jgi:ABC-type dipeptide/oligopeptide/nickel transport system ATPase component